MKINGINSSLAFKRALKPEEIADYTDVMERAREKLGANGKNILYVPDTSLPQKYVTGIGNFGDSLALEYLDTMKTYLGIDTVLTSPQGAYFVDPVGQSFQVANKNNNKDFNPYTTATFLLDDHVINLELLTLEEYGQLISIGDIKHVSLRQKQVENAKGEVNFENILAPFDSSNVEKLLLSAFEKLTPESLLYPQLQEFKKLEGDDVTKRVIFEKLAQKYGTYDWENWPNQDKYLYSDPSGRTEFDSNNQDRINELKSKYSKDIDFAVFKQFFAHKSLEEAKSKMNDKGIKLIGDMPIAFSPDEIWANQQYFDIDKFIGEPGWQIHPIKFEKMYEDASNRIPYSLKMIQKKVEKKMKHYDGIRIDAAWTYIQPQLSDRSGVIKTLPTSNLIGGDNYIGSRIIELIEDTAKKVKGENFDKSDIFYETEVGIGVKFSPFDTRGEAAGPLKNRVQIFTTRYKNADGTWGSYPAYTQHRHLKPEEFILTTTTHDNAPLQNLAKCETGAWGGTISPQVVVDQKAQLEKQFKTDHPLSTVNEFKDAKQAEISLAKNQMRLFYDVFGWGTGDIVDEGAILKKYYATKIGANFKEAYLKALENGSGFNPMNALKQAFISKGLDEKEPELFNEIEYFEDVLRQKSNKVELPNKGSLFDYNV